jgi:hypothetical protein
MQVRIFINRIRGNPRIGLGLFVIAILYLSSVFIHFGRIGWPGLHWDASIYGTPVLNVARGKGWIIGSYSPYIIERDSLAFDYHGILYIFIYGVLFKAATWSRYLLLQGIVNALIFSVYSIFYAHLLTRCYGVRFRGLTAALLFGSIAGVLGISLQGRPDHLAPLVLCIPLAALLFLPRCGLLQTIILGLSLGILIITSPLLGIVFATLLLFYWFGANREGTIAYIRLSLIGIGSGLLLSIVLLVLMTPFSPINWYLNTFIQASGAINFQGILVKYRDLWWGLSLIAPGWNMIALFFIAISAAWIWLAKRSPISMFFFAIAFAFLNEKMCDYSYFSFFPFAVALCMSKADLIPHLFPSRWEQLFVRYSAIVVASAYAFVLFSYVVVSISLPNIELSIVEAQQRFKNSPAGREFEAGAAAVGFPLTPTPSLVVFGDASTRFAGFTIGLHPIPSDSHLEGYEKKTGLRVDWLVYPQTATRYSGSAPAHVFIGKTKYSLVESQWTPPAKIDYRVRPSHLSNRYNFAIYRRQK